MSAEGQPTGGEPAPRHKLQGDTLLQRSPGLRLQLWADNSVDVTFAGRTVRFGRHAVALLDAFALPTRLHDVLATLRCRSPMDCAEAVATARTLHEAGLLVPPGEAVCPPDRGFGAAGIHVAMLNDRARVEAYLEALRRTVRPDDVVVDIGTGTGILALAAARAGARRVFAIEAGAMADVAQSVFAASEFGNRIELIRGWSTEVVLPERASLLVSELIGTDPLGENLLAVVADARRRLLRPDARHLPDRLRVCALPVTIPPARLARHAVMEETLANWRAWYGVDLSPLRRMEHSLTRPLFHVRPQEAAAWPVLTPPLVLAEYSLADFTGGAVRPQAEARFAAAGTLNGLLLYFELGLGPVTLSTHPACAADSNHWFSPVYWLPKQPSVCVGELASFSIQHRPGAWQIQLTGLQPAQT